MMRAAGCWLLAAACWLSAGEDRLVRGPWLFRAADGAPRLACAVAGSPASTLHLAGTAYPAPPERLDGTEPVLVHRLPRGAHGAYRWEVAGQVLEGLIPPAPAPDAPARVVVASAQTWPSASQVAALAQHLGGPPQLVLALGPGTTSRLGTGGWEASLPVALVGDDGTAVDGEGQRWWNGLRVGCLGLPAAPDRTRADLAIARDLSPWLVYLDVPAGWDPALSQPRPGSPQELAVLISACQRLQVPLVLGGGGAGLVSDPLAPQGIGRVQVAAGGVRYAQVQPAADDGLARLDDEVAMALEPGAVAGLVAEVPQLALLLLRPGETAPLAMRWTRAADGGPARGIGEVAPLVRQVVAAEDLATAGEAIERLWLLPRTILSSAVFDAAQLTRLRDEGGAAGRALVRRLQVVRVDDPKAARPDGDPDPLVARDVLLWRITRVRGREAAGWRDEAAATTDTQVLRALLADVARDPERELLPALVQRVRLQAEGAIPLDADQLLQHKLFAAVFDNPYLSPTPLRPLAVALRERAGELGRGPIERFLKRHGEQRAP